MYVKTKLRIGVIGSGIVIIALLAFQASLMNEIAQENKNHTISEGVIEGAFQLNILTNDYLLHKGDRAEKQWIMRHSSLTELLESVEATNSDRNTLLEGISDDNERMGRSFNELTKSGISGQLEERLNTQISITSQSMIRKAFQIDEIGRSDLDRTQQTAALSTFVSIGILMGIIGVNLSLAGSFSRMALDNKKMEEESRLIYSSASLATTSDSFEEGVGLLLDRVCEYVEWPVGHLFVTSPEGDELKSTSVWHLDDPERFRVFREITEKTTFTFKHGIGLPGRVLKSGKPTWIPDVQEDKNFPRNKLAKDIGVRGAFGFPINVGRETVAVLEFFTDRKVESNPDILRVVELIGSQVGGVLERERNRASNIEQEEKVRTMNEVARSIAHDIRNPLHAIRTANSMINDGSKDEQKQLLDMIDKQVVYADGIVKNLMDFSTLPTPKLTLSDINQVLRDTLPQFLLPKNVKLSTAYGELPKVKIDTDQMRRVFSNLILNAIQAMASGGELEVATRSVKNFIEVNVKDTGLGISKKDMGKIFDPFYTTKAKGTGLGLPSVKTIVEKHAGTITIDSKLGGGTTVTVRLPVMQA